MDIPTTRIRLSSSIGLAVFLALATHACNQLEFTPEDRGDRTSDWDGPGDAPPPPELVGGVADAVISGSAADQHLGEFIAVAGDVNGDGHDDLLVSSREWPGHSVHLILGPIEGEMSVADAQAHLYSEADGAWNGWAMMGLGDQDGDGLDDFAVGVPGLWMNEPTSFVQVVLTLPEGSQSIEDVGFVLAEESPDSALGSAIATPGDVDGDGTSDLLIGALRLQDVGGAYLWPGPVVVSDSVGNAAARLVGVTEGCCAGWSASGAGDVNDDGLADVFLGSSCEPGTPARAHLVLGPLAGDVTLDNAEAVFIAPTSEDVSALTVAGGEDLDGDGHEDLVVVTEVFLYEGVGDPQTVFLVRGPSSGEVDLLDADAVLVGEGSSYYDDESSLTSVGDLDGDGLREIVVGAPRESREGGRGLVRVLDGGLQGSIELEQSGTVLHDGEYSYFGNDVVGLGETHLLVGAPDRTLTYLGSGAVYSVRLDSL